MRALLTAIGLSCLMAPASPALAGTTYTGDKIDGAPVISQLAVNDLACGAKYRFWFQGADNAIGQHEYLPVLVAKGCDAGPRLGLQSALHGDELNGTRSIQMVFDGIDVKTLKGAVIGAIGVNPTGMLASNRNYQEESDGGSYEDPNRVWPGKEHGSAAEVHIWKLWNKLWGGNVDLFIDMHTQSRGTAYPLFVYADVRNPKVLAMARLIPADQIKMDPGQHGSAETTFDENQIPAITMEIGSAKLYQWPYIDKSVIGVRNVMIANGMQPGKLGMTAAQAHTYWGNDMTSVRATVGGFAQILVKLDQDVHKGERIALQRNPFGDVIQQYLAPVDGRVLSIGNDPLREPGALLVRILSQNPSAACKQGC